MRGMSEEHLARYNKRLDAASQLTDEMPTGFTIDMLFKRFPDLFTNKRQATEFIMVLGQTSRKLTKKVTYGECLYKYSRYTLYEQLHKLWKVPSYGVQ